MDNNEFDKLIKNKIKEELPVIAGNNIDDIIDNSFKKVKDKNEFKFSFKKSLVAAMVFFIIGSISFRTIKNNPIIINGNMKEEIARNSKEELAIVDIAKEKENLKQEGYIVSKDSIVIAEDNGSSVSACKAYSMTLKDQVFSSDHVLKGQVLGVSYFISNNQAFTKAKVLVEESYDDTLEPGSIITVNKYGGIITHYEFIIKEGIDKKFNMAKEELEETKKKSVVADNYDGKMLYPDDKIVLLINKNFSTPIDFIKGEYSVNGTIVKYKDSEIIKPDYMNNENLYYSEFSENEKEFYVSSKFIDLEGKLKNTIDEKKNFSKEKVRKVAYVSLSEDDKKRIKNWEDAHVIYHSNVNFNENKKNIKEQIDVIFEVNDRKANIFIYMDSDYNIISIYK
ncbi:MAG: hypothetical protein AB6733_20240 [Clostridiaceae bacterium]